MKHHVFDDCLDLGKLRIMFIHFLISILLDGTNQILHGELVVIQIVVHIVLTTWNCGAWLNKGRDI